MRIFPLLFLLMSAVMSSIVPSAADAQSVMLYAAGSLRTPLGDVVKVFTTENGAAVATTFGPSGALKDEIAGGAPPAAAQLAAYILSPAGQRILQSYGFGPIAR